MNQRSYSSFLETAAEYCKILQLGSVHVFEPIEKLVSLAIKFATADVMWHIIEHFKPDVSDLDCRNILDCALRSQTDRKAKISLLVSKYMSQLDICSGDEGLHPLHEAAQMRNPSALQALIDSGMENVNVQDNNGKTPLHHAAEFKRLANIQELCKQHKIDVNIQDVNGNTPCHYAAMCSHAEIISNLLDEGARCVVGENGNTPLHCALKQASVQNVAEIINSTLNTKRVVELLLDFDRQQLYKINADKQSPLHIAAKDADPAVFKTLILRIKREEDTELFIQKDKNGDHVLHFACSTSRSPVEKVRMITKILTFQGCNHDLMSPLHLAASKDQSDILEMMLGSLMIRSDVNIPGNNNRTPLHYACSANSVKNVEHLLDTPEIDVNKKDVDKRTPLHYCCFCSKKSDQIVQLLLNKDGTIVNSKDLYGDTPCHLALKEGRYDVVKLLLQCEAIDVNLQDSNGNTTCHLAVKNRLPDIVELILRHKKLDVKRKNSGGVTVCGLAMTSSTANMLSAIMRHPSVDVNAQSNGQTVAHYAIQHDLSELLQELMSEENHPDFDISSVDSQHRTLADLALELNRTDMLKLIFKDPRFTVSDDNINGTRLKV